MKALHAGSDALATYHAINDMKLAIVLHSMIRGIVIDAIA